MRLNNRLDAIEGRIDYNFKNKDVLLEALTHKSYCVGENKDIMPNERLEFLGDALLGVVMAESLMTVYPKDNEGLLSKKRASLINQDVLSHKAIAMDIPAVLVMGPGEKNQGSHLKPRLLASAFEAIIGAIYCDGGFAAVKLWIEKQFEKDIELIKPDLEYEKDYKTRLQEITRKMNLGLPEYKLIATNGPSHNPEFIMALFIGQEEKLRSQGKSKKAAEQKLAQMYLDELIK